MVSQSPQPYEVARPSNADQIAFPSSMGSDGYEKVRDGRGQEVKEYDTVNFESEKRTKQNQSKTDQGYEVVGEAAPERASVGSRAIKAYATITMEEAKAAETKPCSPVVYSTLESPKGTSYLNVPPKTSTQQVSIKCVCSMTSINNMHFL